MLCYKNKQTNTRYYLICSLFCSRKPVNDNGFCQLFLILVKEYIYVSSQARKIWKLQIVQMNLHINDTVVCFKLVKKNIVPLYPHEDILYFITAEFVWTSTVMWATNFLMLTIVLSYSEFNIYSHQHYSVFSFIMTVRSVISEG